MNKAQVILQQSHQDELGKDVQVGAHFVFHHGLKVLLYHKQLCETVMPALVPTLS